MRLWAIVFALVFLAAAASAATYQPTVNPLIPVQNTPLSSLPIRNNFQYIYNDEVAIAALISGGGGGGSGTVTTVTCSTTAPSSCSVGSPTTTPALSFTFPEQGNGSLFQLSSGSTSTNDIVVFDANGNTIDGGQSISSLVITLPTSGDIVVSNGTNSPAGLVEVDGDCVKGVSGSWAASSCGSSSGVTLANTTSNVAYPIGMTTTTSGSLSTLYGNSSATYNPSSATLSLGSGGVYAIAGTQIACANLSNGATGCSTATGTSGGTIPLLNGANTWSGVQSFNVADLSAANVIVTSSTAPTNGMYLPAANTLGFTTSTTETVQLNPITAGVDYVSITGGKSGTAPKITVNGSTNNQSLSITATGTGTVAVNNLTVTTSGSVGAITNGFYNTAASGNTFEINGSVVSTTTGSGAAVLATSPTLTTPNIGVATGTSFNNLTVTTSGSVGAITNGFYNTAGSGNTFEINGSVISAVTGSGSAVLATSPTLTTPTLGVAVGTSLDMTTTTATKPVNGMYSPSANNLYLTTSGNNALELSTTGNVPEVLSPGAFVSTPNTLTISTSTFTPVAVSSNTYRVVLVHASCPCTIAAPSGTPADGQKFILELWQSSSGSDTVSFTTGSSNSYDFGTAGAPTLSTGANKGDFLGFSYSAQNSRYNYIGVQQGM